MTMRVFHFICLMCIGFPVSGYSAPPPVEKAPAASEHAPAVATPMEKIKEKKGSRAQACLERGDLNACEDFLRSREGGDRDTRARILAVVCQGDRATAHMANCLELASAQESRGELGLSNRLYSKLCEVREGEALDIRCMSHARRLFASHEVEQARALSVAMCASEHWAACTFLGVIAEEHDEDSRRARALYEEAVEGGDEREALWRLGDVHMWGKGGVSQDKVVAFELFERSCEAGSFVGCVRLGRMWQFGQGVESRDFARAQQYYARACDGGNGEGCVALGHLYEAGLTSEGEQMAQAFALYERGCRQGALQGCVDQGFMYERGRGTARDVEAARKLYDEACHKGERDGCHRLLDQQAE